MTTDLRERQTGDPTYKKRLDRYEFIMGRLKDTPKPTYEQLGREVGEREGVPSISRQNVSRLVNRGAFKPAGRQPTNEGRRKRVMARIAKWQARRTANIVAGKPTLREDNWISDLEARLRQLA